MTATPSMILHDTRLSSFLEITKPKSKSKPAFPLAPSSHPYLTPIDLANAGFFHDPGQGEDSWDTCRCFFCGLKLGGWDEGDDPFEEHVKRGSCAWAELVCQPRVHRAKGITPTFPTAESLPSSAESSTMRETTYLKAWPHKQKARWLPTVKTLAKAGFVLNAAEGSRDAVLCPYCEYGVEGWEATDDPWTIHIKKSPQCLFFVAEVASGDGSSSKAARRATKGPVKRSKRGTTVAPPSQAQSEVGETAAEDESELSAPPVRPARKPRATTARGKNKVESEGTVELGAESEAIEVGSVAEIIEEQILTKKTRSKIKGKAKAKGDAQVESPAIEVVEEVEQGVREVKSKRGRPKKKTMSQPEVEPEVQADVELVNDTPPSQSEAESVVEEPEPEKDRRKTVTRSKSTSRKKPVSTTKAKETQPPQCTQPAALSQLDRFANVPPSSPFPSSPRTHPHITSQSDLTPRPRSTLVSSIHTRPSAHLNLARETLDKSVARGAMEVRRVMEDLALNNHNRQPEPDTFGGRDGNDQDDQTKLSVDQKNMTLEELVRYEMKVRYQQMEKEGEDLIGSWVAKTKESRKRIEGI